MDTRFQKAALDLANLAVKHTADKYVSGTPRPAVVPVSGLGHDARIARENQLANAHDALADLTATHDEAVDEDETVGAHVTVHDDSEYADIEIRVGNKIVRVSVE